MAKKEMREALEAAREAMDTLVESWDEDRVDHYPPELGDLNEVVGLLGNIDVAPTPEHGVAAVLERAGFKGDVDNHTGALFYPMGRASVGVLFEGEWLVYFYPDCDDNGVFYKVDVEVAPEAPVRDVAEAVANILRAGRQDVMVSDLPGFDDVEAVGFDGTQRGLDGRPPGEPVTWRMIAERAAKHYDYLTRIKDTLGSTSMPCEEKVAVIQMFIEGASR